MYKDKIHRKCIELAKNSECTKMKFGCVITDENGEILGEGFNHFVDSCVERVNCCEARKNIPSGTRLEYCIAVHAEQAALADAVHKGVTDFSKAKLYVAGIKSDGSLFFQTDFYCSFCARILKEFGANRIFVISENGWVERSITKVLLSSFKFALGEKKVAN